MAIYTMQIKTVSRSSGHSATAKIAYNCRDKITDLRTGEIHKYNSKKMSEDLVHSEITYKDLTLDKKERSEIWNNAELAENRKDSRTAREYVVALPKELSTEQNIELVREFAKELTSKYNNLADWAIHNEKDGNGNIHAHILTTTREFNPETKQLGERTAIEWNNIKCQKNNVPVTQEQIKEIRKDWETIQNKHLAMAGLDLAVSCERKEDRETVKKHLGKEAVSLERQGIETELGNHNRTIDNVVQLERQIYSDGNNLARERAELERLELQKQAIERQQRIDEQLKQQLELARQHELMRLELLRQEQAKQAEEKKQAELKAKEQEKIARLKVPTDNFITANSRYKLFDIAREHKEFFTKQNVGDYEYWTSRNGDIDVHKTHININKQSDESIKLALDVAVSQFGDKLNINGNDDFIKATIEIIASDERYAKISLDKPEHQEMLDSKRLDIEIEKAVDLDLDNIPDLDISNAPDMNLDEPKQQRKHELEHKMDRGWGMSR
ncbi:MobA/MobL family protein [uncultured Agitococcus sp.]|uniref:MobA/MobL family protein n=1 Tax=uncultured Agitococcus sp. TaxID=1506599 RepID=UPI0026324303|nr:MobA/MobL family protein [uncultured Agitococcus sp.]